MRCPDCNKMVSYDTEMEVEVNGDPEFDGETFRVEDVRRVLGCAECSTELKEGIFEVETSELTVVDPEEAPAEDHEHEYEVEAEAEPTMGSITTDRNGKKITNPRYMKTTYGVSVSFTAKCKCGQEITATATDEMAASWMDELT